jgi:7-cyano-7-deazaguanine synthase in queuosine biosynthesis
MNYAVNRCAKCLIPLEAKGVMFTKDNICHLCMEDEKLKQGRSIEASTSVAKIIKKIKERGRGKSYDCLVGLSGGIDSTYLLYQLVKKHGLRCMAAYYRTPFTPKIIDKNVKKTARLLNVQLVEIKLPLNHHESIARKFVIKWSKSKEKIMANLACAPCKLLHRELFTIADNHSIPAIVHGDNKYEHSNIAAGQFKTNKKDRYSFYSNVLRAFLIAKRGGALIVKHPSIIFDMGLVFKASVLYLNPYTAYLRLRYPVIFVVNYFDYVEWNEAELNEALDKLDWKLPEGCYSAKKADCEFAELKNLMFKEAVGATYSDYLFSNLIRYGKLSKEEAIERYDKEGRFSMLRFKNACKKLNIPQRIFNVDI